MAYEGSTTIGSGLTQRGNNTYPLVHASAVQIGDDENSRLDDVLSTMSQQIEAKAAKGDKGDPGAPGAAAGFGNVTATIGANTGDGPSVTVTTSGPNTAKAFQFTFKGIVGATGAKGATGATGAPGANGTTYTPSVSSDGVLSWSNNGGKTNPASVNLVEAVIAQFQDVSQEGA